MADKLTYIQTRERWPGWTTTERDAHVAEYVMGWIPSPIYPGGWKDGDRFVHKWLPTTNIGAAWEVAEKLVADGCYVEVMNYRMKWRCNVNVSTAFNIAVPADSAAEAICLAAALAIAEDIR